MLIQPYMDNTTEQQNMQEELSPEEAKATLGLATRFGEQYLMSQVPQEAPEMDETAPEQGEQAPTEEVPEEDKSVALEGKMDEKMEILRTEMKDTIKLEMDSIRNDIKEALANEQE